MQVKSRKSAASVDYDVILIQRIAMREEQAFALFYEHYGNQLYGFAYRMLQNHDEAKEALQDVLVQIWKRAAVYDESKASPLTWTIMILRRLCIDRLRAQRRKGILLDRWQHAWPAKENPHNHSASPFSEADVADCLGAALRKLPPEQWEAIAMAFYQGMTQGEIAQATLQPLGTIKARIRRGMLKLRELLRDIYA